MDTAVLERCEAAPMAQEGVYSVEGAVLKRSWAIICPGPSLSLYKHFECDQGCLIAVNQAVLSTIPDWWAMIDDEVLEVVMKKINIRFFIDSVTLWIPEKWNERFNYGRIPPIFDRFKKETWKDLSDEIDIGKGINGFGSHWKDKTLYSAIALAIKKGARVIRVYGADFRGNGYFLPGLETRRHYQSDERWKDEQFWFEHIIAICKRHDIEIIRETPK